MFSYMHAYRITKPNEVGINNKTNTWTQCTASRNERHKEMEHIPCSRTGKIKGVKMAILPKALYRINVVPLWIPMMFYKKSKPNISEIHREQ